MAGRTAVRSASGGSLGALTPARLAAAAAATAAGGGGGGERGGGAGGVAILQTERNHVVRGRRCSRSLAPRSCRCARAHTHTHARACTRQLLVCSPAAQRGRTYVIRIDRTTGALRWTGQHARDVFATEADALAHIAAPGVGEDGVRHLRYGPTRDLAGREGRAAKRLSKRACVDAAPMLSGGPCLC